jgi:UDP-N-acetyl-D-glucosamine dehydrogenase
MKVAVVGLGYVGLPLTVAFAETGDDVVALDVDPLKVSAVGAGESYVEDIPLKRLGTAEGQGHLQGTRIWPRPTPSSSVSRRR